MPVELDHDNAVSYLREHGVVPAGVDATCEPLGWGISNFVAKVSWDDSCVVVKQSLARLRVEQEWLIDRTRIEIEERCMRYLSRLLSPGAVPGVVHSDRENYVFAMTCAPAGGTLWKESLLAGRTDSDTARRVGSLLALVHLGAANDPVVQEEFADQTVLRQGRIDPYHLAAAAAHPDLAEPIFSEVDRLLRTRRTLVLGDYSPKNIIAYPDRVFLLDFEVAHWGDPAFDVAFCLSHLILKAFALAAPHAYLALARAFWESYSAAVGRLLGELESPTVREVGCLLLARIDGKSPVEYIGDEEVKDAVRSCARRLLTGSGSDVHEMLASLEDALTGVRTP